MSLYKLYTEDKNRDEIIKLTNKYFESYTIIYADGYYKGVPEESMIIEIDTTKDAFIHNLAEDIKLNNSQESVLIQKVKSESELI